MQNNINYKNRPRFSLDEARRSYKTGNAIKHILDNQDGTYSMMSHINCEHCDYCDQYNDWYKSKKLEGFEYPHISELDPPTFIGQEDPYKMQKVKHGENYGLINSFNPENTITLGEVEKYWTKVISETISLEDFKKVLTEKGYTIIYGK